nr:PREDICTED: BTB/POZ domain-containing protein 16 isoform X9 [Lepisosteus oculatus]
MAQVLPRDGSGTIPRLAPGHPLQNTFVPNPPPTHMTPAAACIISLLQAPYKALEDKPSEEVRVPSSPRGRLRKQAGNTNRWQLPFPLGSDLLGQAQAARAVRATINATLRGIRTADSPFCECEEPTGPEPTLPRLVLSRGTATPTHQTCCVRLTGSPGPATPEDLFYLYSRRVAHNTSPDVILECLGSYWELHCPYLTKSVTLTELYTTAKEQRVKTSSNGTDCPGSRGDRKSDRMGSEPSRRFTLGTSKPASSNPLLLRLPVNDPTISKEALSVALRSLYSSEPRVQLQGVEGVLSAAALLGMPLLFRRCLSAMMNNISPCTVCHFHSVASKYREAELQRACERWLELSLVTQLQFHISLRDLSLELLQKTLHSPRLFTPIYPRQVCSWNRMWVRRSRLSSSQCACMGSLSELIWKRFSRSMCSPSPGCCCYSPGIIMQWHQEQNINLLTQEEKELVIIYMVGLEGGEHNEVKYIPAVYSTCVFNSCQLPDLNHFSLKGKDVALSPLHYIC